MWFDDFDLDLYKAVPESRELIAPTASIDLITNGSSDAAGGLTHPSVWNADGGSMIAFFDVPPTLVDLDTYREPNGDPYRVGPDPYLTNEKPVKCTFEQAIRDAWIHHYGITVPGELSWNNPITLWHSGRFVREFELLMWHLRKWGDPKPAATIEQARNRILFSLGIAVQLVNDWHEKRLLTTKEDTFVC